MPRSIRKRWTGLPTRDGNRPRWAKQQDEASLVRPTSSLTDCRTTDLNGAMKTDDNLLDRYDIWLLCGSDGPQSRRPRSRAAPALTRVQCGIDVLVADEFRPLRGLKVGLVTNHTGVTRDGKSTIDVLFHAPGVKLVKLFSPEHGIRGEVDAAVPDGKDDATGLPIVSLYGKERKPRREDLAGWTRSSSISRMSARGSTPISRHLAWCSRRPRNRRSRSSCSIGPTRSAGGWFPGRCGTRSSRRSSRTTHFRCGME